MGIMINVHRYRQPRFSSRRQYRRVVFKHGECNVVQGKVAKRRRKYLQVNVVCAKTPNNTSNT